VSAAAATPTQKKSPSKKHSSSASLKKTRKHSRRGPRGQQAMDANRVRQIQTALIREHYMSGEPSGVWDARSKDAMAKFQADNGWQTKKLPDSRAIIKLGLGPDHSDLLNPDTAFIAQPQPGKGGSNANER
jgi:peptidoglycan hydrolase-like protein with peptidoglycan-binding domain